MVVNAVSQTPFPPNRSNRVAHHPPLVFGLPRQRYRITGFGKWKTVKVGQEKIFALVANCPGPVFCLSLLDKVSSRKRTTRPCSPPCDLEFTLPTFPLFSTPSSSQDPSIVQRAKNIASLEQEHLSLSQSINSALRYTSDEALSGRVQSEQERHQRHLRIISDTQEREKVKLVLDSTRIATVEQELEEQREGMDREVERGRNRAGPPRTPPRGRRSSPSSLSPERSSSPSPLFRLGGGSRRRRG